MNPEFRIRKTLCGAVRAEHLVEQEEYDLGFTINPIDEHKFHSHLLYRKNIVFIVNARHPLANRNHISIKQLQGQNIAVPHESYKSTQKFLTNCKNAGVTPDCLGETTGALLSHQWVKFNPNVMALTIEPYGQNINDPDVKILYVDDADFSWNPHLIYRLDKKLPKRVEKYVEFILQCFEKP